MPKSKETKLVRNEREAGKNKQNQEISNKNTKDLLELLLNVNVIKTTDVYELLNHKCRNKLEKSSIVDLK